MMAREPRFHHDGLVRRRSLARGRDQAPPAHARRFLHDDEPRSLEVLHKALGDDRRDYVGSVVRPLECRELTD